MIFNDDCFNMLFQSVVVDSSDSFDIILIRPKVIVDPETRTTSKNLQYISFGRGNWDNPMEKIAYRRDGRIVETQTVFFTKSDLPIREGDLILSLKNNRFYDVLGLRDFKSHYEVDTCFIETGLNTKIDGYPEVVDDEYLHFDMEVV